VVIALQQLAVPQFAVQSLHFLCLVAIIVGSLHFVPLIVGESKYSWLYIDHREEASHYCRQVVKDAAGNKRQSFACSIGRVILHHGIG